MIQRAAGNGPEVAFMTAAYVALCRLSSERKNTSDVREKVSVIAGLIGLRYRKTWQLLADLESSAKVIKTLPQDGNPDGQIYHLLPFLKHAPRSAEPMHRDAAPPCTKSTSKRADRLKRKETEHFSRRNKRQVKNGSVSKSNKNRRGSKPSSGPYGPQVLPQSIQTKPVDAPKPVSTPKPLPETQSRIPANFQDFKVDDTAKLLWEFGFPDELHGAILNSDVWQGDNWMAIKLPREYEANRSQIDTFLRTSQWARNSDACIKIQITDQPL